MRKRKPNVTLPHKSLHLRSSLSQERSGIVVIVERQGCLLLLDSHCLLLNRVDRVWVSALHACKASDYHSLPSGFYRSSKAAVQSKDLYPFYTDTIRLSAMGETLAVELAPLNVRVLIVEPGSFRTEGIYGNSFVCNAIPHCEEQRGFADHV